MPQIDKDKINKELTEKILGECWHEVGLEQFPIQDHCSKCKSPMPFFRRNFFSSDDYWKLLIKINDGIDTYNFIDYLYSKWADIAYHQGDKAIPFAYWMFEYLLSTETGPVAVHEFYCKEKK